MAPVTGSSLEPEQNIDLSKRLNDLSQSTSLMKGQEEVDTCRICRGEGTPEEPLFYPCKCSGSIKFVHQECLMEWLSHSQKKHCELCKTSFRFTKLYHPQMPQRLPNSVFLRKAFIHVGKALINWFRGILVVTVWGLWLPWSMRFVWWGLFWIGDGGWNKNLATFKNAWDSEGAVVTLPKSAENGTATSSSDLPHMLQLPAIRQLMSIFGYSNLTSTQTSDVANLTSVNSTIDTRASNSSSLLSDLAFFRDLTPNPGLNKFILDTVEGQIITLSVVTGFILVFLIREWVVQQQPALNFAAMNAGAVNAGQAENPEDDELPEQLLLEHDNPGNRAESFASDHIDNGIVLAQSEDEDLTQISMESIDALIDDLRQRQPALNYLALDDFGDWHGDEEDVKLAQEVAIRTRRLYFNLKKVSKAALDHGSTSEARYALDRLQRMQAALEYLPFKDDEERSQILNTLQDYLNFAYQIVEIGESNEVIRTEIEIAMHRGNYAEQSSIQSNPQDPQELNGSRESNEPLLEESQLSLSDHPDPQKLNAPETLDTTSDQASNAVDAASYKLAITPRPPMTSHTQSSIAMKIEKDVEKSSSPLQLPSPDDSRQSPMDSQNYTPSWSFVDIPREEHHESSSETEDAATHVPPLRRKQKAESLSAEYQDTSVEQPVIDPVSVVATSSSTYNEEEPSSTPITDQSTPPTQLALHQIPAGSGHVLQPENDNNKLQPETRSLVERLLDWVYGDLVPATPTQASERNDEHIVQDLAAEAPFVPFNEAQLINHQVPGAQGAQGAHDAHGNAPGNDAVELAAQALVNAEDAEAIEDAEDLEGILELIGLQGPLFGLFQNAVFAAVLVSATVTTAILFPYLCGKLVLLVSANPLASFFLPFRLVTGLTHLAIDVCAVIGGLTIWRLHRPLDLLLRGVLWFLPSSTLSVPLQRLIVFSRGQADIAAGRIGHGIASTIGASGQLPFHLSSHHALRILEAQVHGSLSGTITTLTRAWKYLLALPYLPLEGLRIDLVDGLAYGSRFLYEDFMQTLAVIRKIPAFINSGGAIATRTGTMSSIGLETVAENWTIHDRVIAVVTGYAFFAVAGTLYINRGAPFASSDEGRKVENIVRDIFQQSAGVVKVILIISLEMLIFPLYCGYLVDVAMLPLFEDSTLISRFAFTLSSPWTSVFFHWFIGTLFMWNFALFVAMCRKIFRKGVLYFIRDPDDPNFHPVRDVLEKSLSSQLRKIAFSALVYGLLILLCMASVVWGVAYGVAGVFPIRWTAKESYFGYPVDLLLYNFLAPLALHFLRPSKGINKVYEWWFRNSARALRLSHFLFDDFRDDERGQEMGSGSDYGTFVRAPGTDSVRIPHGRRVFVEVDENNVRRDGRHDPDGIDEAHGRLNEDFTKVWIPPTFQIRIGAFVVLMWAMTAAIGLCTTVVPLLLGRNAIFLITSGNVPLNDLYSYFVGVAPLVAAFYSTAAIKTGWNYLTKTIKLDESTLVNASAIIKNGFLRALRILYTYIAFIILVPTLLALLLECYFILPLQTYTTYQKRPAAPHTVYLLQDWTLGLMYLRILMRILLWDTDSRASRGLRAIVAQGWTNPDTRIATRCFFLPLVIVTTAALCLPSGLAYALSRVLPFLASYAGVDDQYPMLQPGRMAALQVNMIRFSYPLVLALALSVWTAWLLKSAAGQWRMRIRDEIYLIGERLHNFGDRRPGPAAAGRTGA